MEEEIKPGSQEAERTQPEKNPKELWALARMLSLYDLNHKDRAKRTWAHGNLIELYLLSLLSDIAGVLSPGEPERRAIEHANQLIDIAGRDSFEVYSTRRQMVRYIEWYKDLTSSYLLPLLPLAEQIFERFPADVEERFR
jgi:hypothetical protein